MTILNSRKTFFSSNFCYSDNDIINLSITSSFWFNHLKPIGKNGAEKRKVQGISYEKGKIII